MLRRISVSSAGWHRVAITDSSWLIIVAGELDEWPSPFSEPDGMRFLARLRFLAQLEALNLAG